MKKGICILAAIALLCTACAPKETHTTYKSLEDFKGSKVGSITGSVFFGFVDEKIPEVTHLYFNSLSDQIVSLENRKTDALALDMPVAKLITAQNEDLMVFPEVLADDRYGFAVAKGSPLMEQGNAVLERLKEDGTLAAMEEYWFTGDDSEKQLPVLDYKKDFDGSAGTLRYGCDMVVMPMCYAGGDGTPIGFDVDVIRRIAYELNMNVEVTSLNFDALISSMLAGKMDLVGGCMSITPERLESVDFVGPYYEGGVVLVIQKDTYGLEAEKITAISELEGEKVGIMTGSRLYELTSQTVEIEPMYFNSYSDQLLALRSDKISAFMVGEPIARDMLTTNPGYTLLALTEGEPNAFSVTLEHAKLCEEASQVIRQMKEDGTIQRLDEKWFSADEEKKVMEEVKAGEKGTLRFGTSSGAGKPIVYVKDSALVGFELDTAQIMAERLGYSLEFVDMEFGALIPALVSGKVDMIGANMAVTEERAKAVAFLEPNYYDGIVAVVKE